MIYDPSQDDWQSIDNGGGRDASHGAGIQAATEGRRPAGRGHHYRRYRPQGLWLLTAAGIRIYHGAKGSVSEALQAYQAGTLAEAGVDDATGGV
ncbi:MAG: hypothetical protein R2864_10055 [Syntrophotaleaceae bacterium]